MRISAFLCLLMIFMVRYQSAAQKLPTLYLISIGVSKYANDTTLTLKYAAKDAQDIAQLFKTQSKNYQHIHTELLTDEAVTQQSVRKLKTKLKLSQVDDCVIVFYAGHGLLDDNLDYYLGTCQMDFFNPKAKGLAYQDLEDLIDGIPARQKLLLIDACHAGEVEAPEKIDSLQKQLARHSPQVAARGLKPKKQSNTDALKVYEIMNELFIDLRRGTGASILVASGGYEMAYESSEWQNGVFTYCLLNALKNQQADQNKDAKINISELSNYLKTTVSQLTLGFQHPTLRAENLLNDWRVW